MNGWIWAVVIGLGLACFGLGCVTTRAHFVRHNNDSKPVKMISNNRANAFLMIFFTLIALGVATDTIYLQIKINRYMHGQVDCNTNVINHLQTINAQRQKIDNAAAQFDIAMAAYLTTSATRPVIPADDPAYLNLQDKINNVAKERLTMLEVYSSHPPIGC